MAEALGSGLQASGALFWVRSVLILVHLVDGSALRPAAHDTMLAGKAQPVCLDWHLGPEG